ncbi:MAG: hypothetical protein P4L53_11880 [Candidatus Obscuribacterales bacterium]|nr:hypothetical protein [Candidatus Obscuribacterales bacterium]
MKDLFNLQTLKMIGGGAIICAAALIMMPGLISYLAGLSRVLIFITVVLIGAAVLSRVYATINARTRKSTADKSPVEPETKGQD